MDNFQLFLTVFMLGFIAAISHVEGRIKVMSTLDDETVYILREKPIIMNIDSPSRGMLVLAKPVNACSPVNPAPFQPINLTFNDSNSNSSSLESATEGSVHSSDFAWVLLVSWSPTEEDCSASRKAENAAAAGYSVVLFQDPSDYDQEADAMSPVLAPLAPPSAARRGFDLDVEWTEASVYACTINPVDWDVLRLNFTSERYYLSFEDPNAISGWFTYFIVGILVIGAVFFTIGLSYVLVQLLVLILIWIRESIVSRIQTIRRDRRRRLPASQLRKIPIQQWNSDMLQDICSICLESFDVVDRVRILPCSHVFHSACIDPWLLKQRRKCPNCKRKIVFPDENRDSDSSSDDERTPLLRRDSSVRESSSSSTTTSPRISRPNSTEQAPGRMGGENRAVHSPSHATPTSERQQRSNDQNRSLSQENSSINASSEAPGNPSGTNHNPSDLKGKVDQLCARMESVGKKIKKKVKANHSSKLDNDSSSDLSTSVHPVLVSVTVEPNHMSDTDTDLTDCSQPANEESQQQYNCEQDEPTSSGSGRDDFVNNLDSSGQNNNFSRNNESEIEVKVVPDYTSHATRPALTISHNNRESGGGGGEISILSDLNT